MSSYPTPNVITQELLPILEAVAFVDELYFGVWSYNATTGRYPERERFYRRQARIVRAFCREHGIEATIDV